MRVTDRRPIRSAPLTRSVVIRRARRVGHTDVAQTIGRYGDGMTARPTSFNDNHITP